MLANPDIGVTQIAHRLGVSPATLYRYIPAARTANTPSGENQTEDSGPNGRNLRSTVDPMGSIRLILSTSV
jgi:transposase-like protein